MKELTIEQKAQAYDEAIKRGLDYIKHTPATEMVTRQDIFEAIFPELKESKDEKIRNFISNELACLRATDGKGSDRYNELTEAIAWVEKQGEHANFLSKIQIGDKVTRNQDGALVNLSQLNRVAKKPADKVKPKFEIEEGKYYVCTQTYTLRGKIVVIKGQTYKSNQYGAIEGEDGHLFIDKIDGKALNYFKPWIIQDAKAGDVLSDGTTIFIFKDLLSDGSVMSYCDYDTNAFCPLSMNLICSKITPASKEQRDTLEKAMADAGYTFDFEKKELKKLGQSEVTKTSDQVQVPAEWSAEDEEYLNFVIATIKTLQVKCTENEIKHHSSSQAAPYYTRVINWLTDLKELRLQSQWRPNEVQMQCLQDLIDYHKAHGCGATTLESLYNDLKQLKQL